MALKLPSYLVLGSLLLTSSVHAQSPEVQPRYSSTLIFDRRNATHEFAAAEIQRALQESGAAASIVLCERRTPAANEYLRSPGVAPLPAAMAQGYSIRMAQRGIYVIGSDHAGTLYGALDLAQTIRLQGLAAVRDADKHPYILQRGLKFNIPLDGRTPSYSDSGDAAQSNMAEVWDMAFWTEYLDEMARNRFNVLSLWSLHPFPSLVKVPEYPKAALEDVKQNGIFIRAGSTGVHASTAESRASLRTIKRMTMDEKIEFWRAVMQYAHDRGISVYIFTWNTFVCGTEESGYDFTTQLSDLKTQDYFRHSVKALVTTYPLLAGIGVTAGENMSRDPAQDEVWLFKTYGQGINEALASEPERRFRLIHRGHWADVKGVQRAFSKLHPNCTLEWSYKYSRAHMYSSTKPHYIHTEGFLQALNGGKTWLTVRDDDFYMFRWADANFARDFLKNMPHVQILGFYMGPDGTVWGRESNSTEPEKPRQLVLKKRWLSFAMWGQLAYDPNIPDAQFIAQVRARFPEYHSKPEKARQLYEAWATASQIIPLVNRFHSEKSSSDYQWYPEACTSYQGFHDINRFISDRPMRGENMLSIPEYAKTFLAGQPVRGKTPLQVSQEIASLANTTLQLLSPLQDARSKELRQTLGDIKCMALLGCYYAHKIAGATYKHLADEASTQTEKETHRATAVKELNTAAQYWKLYAAQVSKLYQPQILNRITSSNQRYTDIPNLQDSVNTDIMLAQKMAAQ